jgi:hypothetical protein
LTAEVSSLTRQLEAFRKLEDEASQVSDAVMRLRADLQQAKADKNSALRELSDLKAEVKQ